MTSCQIVILENAYNKRGPTLANWHCNHYLLPNNHSLTVDIICIFPSKHSLAVHIDFLQLADGQGCLNIGGVTGYTFNFYIPRRLNGNRGAWNIMFMN